MASQQRAFLLVLLSLLLVCASTVVSAQYSSSFGKRMVHQASVAYCNASVIQNWNCAVRFLPLAPPAPKTPNDDVVLCCWQACAYIPGFKVKAVAYNAPTNTQAYIGWDPNEQVRTGLPLLLAPFALHVNLLGLLLRHTTNNPNTRLL